MSVFQQKWIPLLRPNALKTFRIALKTFRIERFSSRDPVPTSLEDVPGRFESPAMFTGARATAFFIFYIRRSVLSSIAEIR
jgi:hypothetical protein